MKNWKVLLTVIICSGMAFGSGLVGCGTNCEDACNKARDCGALDAGETVQECTDWCETFPSALQDCALDCDTGDTCEEYGQCMEFCGID